MCLAALFPAALALLALAPTTVFAAADISQWCAKTPSPGPCVFYLTHAHLPQPPKDHREFYTLLVQIALGRALRAENHLERLGPLCRGKPERAVWLDCWKLYGNTVVLLNRTLNLAGDAGRLNAVDAQTWLSAALTNTETCIKGFADLKTSYEIIQPVALYNVSDLIRNCLAAHSKKSSNTPASSTSWTASARRKLAQLTIGRADMVVAQDGSSQFHTIRSALDAAKALRLKGVTSRIVVYVKAGVYAEIINVKTSLYDLTLIGDDAGKTIITGNQSVAIGYTTFSSATFSVFGDGFIAIGITFRNTFGPGSQAVALLSGSDRSIFYRCSIEGYQDTLCVYSQRQFYRECSIYGTIDFIFGNAASVIQNSDIYLRNPRWGEANVITAQGRTDRNQNTGIIIQFCNIRAAPELWTAGRKVESYLGRPWQLFSRTLYLQNYIEGAINPAGWLPFNGEFALDTLYYAEFKNTGPGSRMSMRVKWRGYHVIGRASRVRRFTVGSFITGGDWIPPTGVPFSLGF